MQEFHGYGVSFRLRATDDELLDQMAARGSALGWTRHVATPEAVEYVARRVPAEADPPAAASFELHRDGVSLDRSHDLNALLDTFENQAKIDMAFGATGCLFVHAGVVGWRGRAILMPGRSRSGKTTLVEALVALGADYYSDEFAVLEPDGRVRPYAIPLSLRGRAGRPAAKASIESLGGRPGVDALPVGLIVVTHHRPRARWRPRPLSRSEAMLALMDNTVAATRPPAVTMPILRQAALDVRAIHTPRGDARAAASRLLAELA
jgi:hypothetical protein